MEIMTPLCIKHQHDMKFQFDGLSAIREINLHATAAESNNNISRILQLSMISYQGFLFFFLLFQLHIVIKIQHFRCSGEHQAMKKMSLIMHQKRLD